MTPGRRIVPLGAALVAASLGLLALAGPAGALSAVTAPGPYSSYDTGAIHVVLPAALPNIELSQDSNSSLAASLALVKIVELNGATTPGAQPTVVAAAFEEHVETYNTTHVPGAGVVAGLRANLTVLRDNEPLFPLANSDVHVVRLTPIAPTTLTVTVVPTKEIGVVNVTAVVENWPWVNGSDLLAVGWEFGVPGDSAFAGCSGAQPVTVPSTACGPNAFAFGNSTWGYGGFDGVQGLANGGPTAQLRWSSNATTGSGAQLPVVSGAERTGPQQVEVIYGTSASGSSSVTYALSYALVVPTVGPFLLHGLALPFLVGGVAACAAVLGAVYAARRRDRRLLDAL